MIRGLVGAVPHHTAEVGRFYMTVAWGAGAWLFQCIQSNEILDGNPVKKALVFKIGLENDISIHDIPHRSPLVALYDVHVRIDPTSLNEDAEFRANRFFLFGDKAIICVPNGISYGWNAVDINDGRYFEGRPNGSSVSFDRWSLVLDDDSGEEMKIASFDSVSSSTSAV